MSELLDALAQRAGFAMTRAEAWKTHRCVRCGGPAPKHTSEHLLDHREWLITALCGKCFDAITSEPDE